MIINDINHVIWLRVMRPHISNIRLYISDEFGEIKTVDKNKLNCTLLFVPPKGVLKNGKNIFALWLKEIFHWMKFIF